MLLALAALGILTIGCSRTHTATDVEFTDVRGSGRPADDASEISYWSDGTFFFAEYTTSEEGLQRRYKDFEFSEISEPVQYPRLTYGTPESLPSELPPRAPPVTVSNGIRHSVVWRNGGGYDIVFDRTTGRAFVSMSAR